MLIAANKAIMKAFRAISTKLQILFLLGFILVMGACQGETRAARERHEEIIEAIGVQDSLAALRFLDSVSGRILQDTSRGDSATTPIDTVRN